MRRFVVLAAVVLLFLSGCTSGDDPEADPGNSTSGSSGSSTTLDPAEVVKAPGVTADAIKLGISYVDLAAVAAVTTIDHGDYEASFQALIDDLNERGGINGREVVPVFTPIDPIGTEPAEAACLKLTEDDEVFAITGFFLGDTVLCPLENHDTAVIGGEMNPERLERATAPWFTLEQSSDLQSDVIRAFADRGLLDGKLAVFAQNIDADLMENTVEPLLDELGIEPVSTAVLDAPAEDTSAALAQAGVIAERFESAGATKVLVVGNGGVAWAQGLEQTDYRPENLFITTNTILAYTGDEAERDLSVLDGSLAGDLYGPKSAQFEEEGMQQCLSVLEDAGVEVADPGTVEEGEPDGTAAFTACRYMALFEALATEAGEDLNYATLRAAADNLGEVRIPGTPDPYTFGGPPHADGDPAVYVFRWDAAAKDFELDEG